MTAREMFEELGYKKIDNENEIYYSKQNSENIDDTYVIEFDKVIKGYIKYRYYNNAFVFINIKEFKAIQKQIEELGWEENK